MSAEPLQVRIAVSIGAGTAAAMALYALLRVYQSSQGTEPNPALIIWSEHAGYFWRAWTSAYIGGMVALVAYAISSRMAIAPAVARALLIAAALLTVQGLVAP